MNNLRAVIASEAKQSSLLLALDCRVAALLAMTLLAAGCSNANNAEIDACRNFLKGGLRSPSTYQEVSTKVNYEEAVTGDDRKTVFIEYDAANAFGTPIRGTQMCEFVVDKQSEKSKPEPSLAATLASSDRALGRGDGSCCVSSSISDANAVDANMTMDDFLDNNMDNVSLNGASN